MTSESPATPQHLAASALLVTSRSELTLLVANPYREGLVLPGGVVETDESPAAAAEREAAEEVGLALTAGRLLAVQHKPLGPQRRWGLLFVFDTDRVDDDVPLVLQAEEVTAAWWLDPDEAVERHTEGGRARLAAAFRARSEQRTIYLDADRTLG